MKTRTLAAGNRIPVIGFGTFTLKGRECRDAVASALKLGYRHIDTAEMYGNHTEVAAALNAASVPRGELFLTSKVWRDHLRYRDILEACDTALRELETDYLDLLLIHWPNRQIPMSDSFRALAELQQTGKVRSVGVSNFTVAHLQEAREVSEVPVAVNQVEYHPLLNQEQLLDYCREHQIVVEAYSPLAQGELLQQPVLKKIASDCGRTIPEIALRWLIQKGLVALPRSASGEHQTANLHVLDWGLDDATMRAIDGIDEQRRVVHPAFAEFDRT